MKSPQSGRASRTCLGRLNEIPTVREADYLDGQSMRNNCVIDGIQESQSETWAESEDKVQKLFSEELQLDQQVELEKCSPFWETRGH
jgi:hypothetical protein